MSGRTIVVGDVHGCIDELRELLFEVVDVRDTDRIIMLGDLIDKGPDPAGVVALVKGLGATSVMGNHEEKALRWRRHENRRKSDPAHYKNPMRPLNETRLAQWSKISEENWEWINSWPVYININNTFTAVHAGAMPDAPIEKQVPNELMRLRYVRCITDPVHGYATYRMAGLKETGERPDAKEGESIVHWTSLWQGPRSIIYGHYVWDEVSITSSYTGARTFGIDTGCVHGGHLTALVINKDHIYTAQVRAHEVYSDRKFWNEE
jgi:bis(5'-nucleosyl)-tetraphosphatase (symmetrical)